MILWKWLDAGSEYTLSTAPQKKDSKFATASALFLPEMKACSRIANSDPFFCGCVLSIESSTDPPFTLPL